MNTSTICSDCKKIRNKKLLAVLEQVALHRDVAVNELLLSAKSRNRYLADTRHLYMYVAHSKMIASLAEIGEPFGKDHATVLHAIKKYGKDNTFKSIVDEYIKMN